MLSPSLSLPSTHYFKQSVSRFSNLHRRFFNSNSETLQVGDRAILRYRNEVLLLTKPLSLGNIISSRYGDISHDSIIGKRARDIVTTKERCELRVDWPSLDEYTSMTPRIVTPIYSKDANLIVSLLDLHPSPYLRAQNGYPAFEILEAGTGHGALTLHLARAIHAANSAFLMEHSVNTSQVDQLSSTSSFGDSMDKAEIKSSFESSEHAENQDVRSDSGKILSQRRAVIHTVDVSSRHSQHAAKCVKGFCRGLYFNDINFHVGDVSDWIGSQRSARELHSSDSERKPFLSHVILDMPSPEDHLAQVATALHIGGSLLVFNPSITQIVTCLREIKQRKLPFVYNQVLELGPSMTGGREWDLRIAKPRAPNGGKSQNSLSSNKDDSLASDNSGSNANEAIEPPEQSPVETLPRVSHDEDGEIICRPKVGGRVIGGGFLGVWKRMRDR